MIKNKWEQYAEIWSLAEDERNIQLEKLTTTDVVYTDANATVTGRQAFSDFIAGFQKKVPGGGFRIKEALEHHEQSITNWDMVGGDGSVIGTGTSYAKLSERGKFVSFTGFFYES